MKESVQVVILNEKGEVLAVSRKDDHNDFGLIGGKVDPEDTTLENAMIRECKEETGLDISNLRLIFSMHKDGYMGYTYLCDWEGEIYTDEPHIVKWANFEEIYNGSFGQWNRLVGESLKNMGIKITEYSYPMQEFEWSYKPFNIDGGEFLGSQREWHQTLVNLLVSINSSYKNGDDEIYSPQKFQSIFHNTMFFNKKTNELLTKYMTTIKFIFLDSDSNYITSKNKSYRIKIINYD